MLTFDISNHAVMLPVCNGVAAFDPVTLLIALNRVSDAHLDVHSIPAIDLPPSPTLAELATIEIEPDIQHPTKVTVTIDTGVMEWSDKLNPKSNEFEDYQGQIRYGVVLGRRTALFLDGAVVSSAPMKLPNGEYVKVWFAELQDDSDEVDALALLAHALHYQQQWENAEHQKTVYLTVPAQNLTYQSVNSSTAHVTQWGPTEVTQKFAAALDETGARVIAQTIIQPTGLQPNFAELPEDYRMGERGPVMIWWTDYQSSTPFSIIYTQAAAWLEPDDTVDLEIIALPV